MTCACGQILLTPVTHARFVGRRSIPTWDPLPRSRQDYHPKLCWFQLDKLPCANRHAPAALKQANFQIRGQRIHEQD